MPLRPSCAADRRTRYDSAASTLFRTFPFPDNKNPKLNGFFLEDGGIADVCLRGQGESRYVHELVSSVDVLF